MDGGLSCGRSGRRCGGSWLGLALLAAAAAAAWTPHGALGASQNCQAVFDQYLEKHHKEASPYTGKNLLYFLHVPRTAGRTFHSCLLKMATPPARRCPKAYDHLRLNFSVPNCYLLSSHDDFSVVSMLPDNVAVLSQVRDPVDRFLSAYEFAIEVAARMLTRPKSGQRKKPGRIATEDVWPWSYLVPWFNDDIEPRVGRPGQAGRETRGFEAFGSNVGAGGWGAWGSSQHTTDL